MSPSEAQHNSLVFGMHNGNKEKQNIFYENPRGVSTDEKITYGRAFVAQRYKSTYEDGECLALSLVGALEK